MTEIILEHIKMLVVKEIEELGDNLCDHNGCHSVRLGQKPKDPLRVAILRGTHGHSKDIRITDVASSLARDKRDIIIYVKTYLLYRRKDRTTKLIGTQYFTSNKIIWSWRSSYVKSRRWEDQGDGHRKECLCQGGVLKELHRANQSWLGWIGKRTRAWCKGWLHYAHCMCMTVDRWLHKCAGVTPIRQLL